MVENLPAYRPSAFAIKYRSDRSILTPCVDFTPQAQVTHICTWLERSNGKQILLSKGQIRRRMTRRKLAKR